jgi:hypothetical protein
MAALDEGGLHLIERDAFFMPPRPGNQNVLDVFPEGLVLLEIDYAAVLRPFSSVMNCIPVTGVSPLGVAEPILSRHTGFFSPYFRRRAVSIQ